MNTHTKKGFFKGGGGGEETPQPQRGKTKTDTPIKK